jgi:hypothetical protein
MLFFILHPAKNSLDWKYLPESVKGTRLKSFIPSAIWLIIQENPETEFRQRSYLIMGLHYKTFY